MSKNPNGNIHRTETPDVSHIRNVEVTHERSDVNVSAIVKFVLALTVMTVVVYILMWGMFRLFYAQGQKRTGAWADGNVRERTFTSGAPAARCERFWRGTVENCR